MFNPITKQSNLVNHKLRIHASWNWEDEDEEYFDDEELDTD